MPESKNVNISDITTQIGENEASVLKFKWIMYSLLVGLPFFALSLAGYIPILAVIPIFFVIGFFIAVKSPGKTYIEPVIGADILTIFTLFAMMILLEFESAKIFEGLLNKFLSGWNDAIHFLQIGGLTIGLETRQDKYSGIIFITVLISIIGSSLSFLGAFLGEKYQESKLKDLSK